MFEKEREGERGRERGEIDRERERERERWDYNPRTTKADCQKIEVLDTRMIHHHLLSCYRLVEISAYE